MRLLSYNTINGEKPLIEPCQGFELADKWFNFAYKNVVVTTTTTANNTMRFSMVQFKRKYTFKSVAINVTGSNAAGRFMKIGFYSNNVNRPQTLIQDLGIVELLTIGEVSIGITGNLVVYPGIYWIGGNCNGTSSVSAIAGTAMVDILGGGGVATHVSGYQMTSTYSSSLPTTASGLTTTSSATSYYLQTV